MKFKYHWQAILFGIVLLLSAITYFTYQTNYNRLEQEAVNSLQTRAQSKAQMFSTRLNEVTSNLKFMQSVPPIQGIIRATNNNGIDPLDQSSLKIWKARLGEIFKSYVLSHDDVYQIRYIGLDNGGSELVRVDRTVSGAQITPESKLQKKGDRDYFKEITSAEIEGVFISNITLNRELGSIQIPHNPTIRLAVKAYTESGDLFGFIIINKSITPLFEDLATDLPRTMNMFVLNDKEQFLYHPDSNIAFDFETGNGTNWNQYISNDSKNNATFLVPPKDAISGQVNLPLMKGKNALTIKILESKKDIWFNALANTFYAFFIFIISLAIFLIFFTLYRKSIKSQTELTLEKARNSSIVEGSQDAIIAVTMEGKITDWNPSASQMFGYSKEEVIGQYVRDIVHTSDNAHEESSIRQTLLLGGQVKAFESVRKAKNDRLIPVSVSASPIKNESGNIIGVSKIIRDITEKKQVADELEELNHTLEQQVQERTLELQESYGLQTAILDNAAHIIIATDTDGVITLFNPAAEAHLEYSASEVVGIETPKLFHLESEVIQRSADFTEELKEDVIPGFDVFIAKSKKGLKNEHEWTYISKSGAKVPVYLSVTSLHNNKGEINGYLGMATDITEVVDNKNKLEALKDQLTKASEIADIGIWSWNTSTNDITWNPIMFDIYDVEQGNKIEFDCWVNMVVDEDRERAIEHFKRFAEEGHGTDITFDILTQKGIRKTIHATATVETNLFDSSISMVGVNKDISKQIRSEQALKTAKELSDQANQTKSEFVANMSHEIRTPMSAIIGLLELLRRTELTSKQLDYVSKSDSAAKSLLHILNDILDFSKVEAGKLAIDPHPFCLSDLIENVTTVLSPNIKGKDVELIIDLDPKLPSYVTLDSLRLQQIIVNIAGNSIKFTHAGIVSVKVMADIEDERSLVIVISDTGIGIPKEKQEKMFESFSQAEASIVREYGGTGLGLAISQKLIALMGGTISFESEVNVGTVFTIKLPYSNSLLTKSYGQINKNLNVLVVDDREESLEAISHVIDTIGWKATLASSGLEALKHINASATSDEPFDLILMDWNMPEMSGWDTIVRINDLGRDVFSGKIFVVTAYGDSVEIKRSHDEEEIINTVISKPLTASILVDRYLESASTHIAVTEAFLSKNMSLKGMNILLAEDNSINQLVAREILEAEGAMVTIASNGHEAIELLYKSDEMNFDIILMDVQMPVMDGYTASKKIRAGNHASSIPIIAMTANALDSDKKDALDAGMNTHVSKPFDADDLIAQICMILKGRKTSFSEPSTTLEATVRPKKDEILTLNVDGALKRLGGNHELYIRALSGCLQTTPQVWEEIKNALEENDREKLPPLVHTLKGVASTVGADELEGYIKKIEADMRTNHFLLSEINSNEFYRLFQNAISAMEIYIENNGVLSPPKEKVLLTDAEFLIKLEELKVLMKKSNMKAITLFNELTRIGSEESHAILSEIQTHIDHLDFPAAVMKIERYIGEINE